MLYRVEVWVIAILIAYFHWGKRLIRNLQRHCRDLCVDGARLEFRGNISNFYQQLVSEEQDLSLKCLYWKDFRFSREIGLSLFFFSFLGGGEKSDYFSALHKPT